MGFSEKVQVEALVACGRYCCICHRFCGTKIALHHIKQRADGGDDSFENCIPLCLDCHEDMGKADPRHVTGKHYTENELRMHRDKWYEQCSAKVNPPITAENEIYEDTHKSNMIYVEMRNAAGGHTVIIDDEKYIAERVFEEHNREIEALLKEI